MSPPDVRQASPLQNLLAIQQGTQLDSRLVCLRHNHPGSQRHSLQPSRLRNQQMCLLVNLVVNHHRFLLHCHLVSHHVSQVVLQHYAHQVSHLVVLVGNHPSFQVQCRPQFHHLIRAGYHLECPQIIPVVCPQAGHQHIPLHHLVENQVCTQVVPHLQILRCNQVLSLLVNHLVGQHVFLPQNLQIHRRLVLVLNQPEHHL